VFGPLVAFGPGGVLAELIGSANFALAPLTDVDAAELISTGKAGKLVDGWRGAPPADRAALADLLHRLSRLALELPGGLRARPQSGAGRAKRLRCRRCPHQDRPVFARRFAENLVSSSVLRR